jgi:hypothetical protein
VWSKIGIGTCERHCAEKCKLMLLAHCENLYVTGRGGREEGGGGGIGKRYGAGGGERERGSE